MEPGISFFEKCAELGLDPVQTTVDEMLDHLHMLQRSYLRRQEMTDAEIPHKVRPRLHLHDWRRPGTRFVPPAKKPVMR